MKNAAGFTLLEVIIASALIGIVATPLTLFLINGMRSYNTIDMQTNASTELVTLSGKITSVIRNATVVTDASDNSLTVLAYAKPTDTVVSQYRYFITGNTLSVGVTPASGSAPNYTYPSSNEVVKNLRTDLSMGGVPLFTYFDENDNQLTGTIDETLVGEVGVFISVNPNTIQFKNPISITNQVSIRNLKDNL
jgi:prepilin-type N-terminal cleavage/methylation domain-containing protein